MAATIVSGLPSGRGSSRTRTTSDRHRAKRRTSPPSRARASARPARRWSASAISRSTSAAIASSVRRRWRAPHSDAGTRASARIGSRFDFGLRAPPPSCRAARRPTANASKGAITFACTNAGLALAPHPLDRFAHRPVAGEEVGSVAAPDFQVGKRFDQARDVTAGRLHLDRHRDRVAVVFDQIQHRRAAAWQAVLSDSQNSPSLVAPSPIERYVTSSAWNRSARSGMSLTRSYSMPASAQPTACRHCVPVGLPCDGMLRRVMAPVRRHLTAARIRIVLRAHGAESSISSGVMPSVRQSARSR